MRPHNLAQAVAALIGVVTMAGIPLTAAGQTGDAYVSAGPAFVNGLGGRNSAWPVGAGAEVRIGDMGFGGGLDHIYFPQARKRTRFGSSSSPAASVSAVSFNTSYYFKKRDVDERRMQPFMTFGLTFMLEREALPMLNLSGGVDWWGTRHAGVRVEVRSQFVGVPTSPVMLAVRCGIVLR